MIPLLVAAAMVAAPPHLSGAAAGDTIPGEVTGVVRRAEQTTPIPGAVVVARKGDFHARVRTGPSGHYRIPDVPPGWVTVAARQQGYRRTSLRVRVPEGQSVTVRLDLKLDPIELPAIDVRGLPAPLAVDESSGERSVAIDRANPGSPSIAALRSGAVGGSGVGRTVRRVTRPDGSNTSLLYFRAGAAPYKQTYLDGAPVKTPFHLGGLLSAHPKGVLASSRLHGADASTQLGGGLLYTLQLETRSPRAEGSRSSADVNVLGASARTSGTVGRGSYLLSARSLYGQGVYDAESVADGRDYSDFIGRLAWGDPNGSRVGVTGFWNREAVPLAASPSARRAEWGNTAGSLRFTVGENRSRAEGTLASGRFESEMPLAVEGFSGARATLREDRATIRWIDGWSALILTTGFEYRRRSRTVAFLGKAEEPEVTLAQSARRVGGFLEANWQPDPVLSLRAGLRGDRFSPTGSFELGPRISASVRVDDHTRVRLSGGRLHQLVATPITRGSGQDQPARSPREDPIPAAAPLRPEVADHFSVSVEHQHGETLTLGLESQLRLLHDLADPVLSGRPDAGSTSAQTNEPRATRPATGPASPSPTTGSDLYTSGVDLWLDWNSDAISAWGTYSLTWLWSGDQKTPAVSGEFATRQVLSTGTELRAPGELLLTLEAEGSWGLPLTPVPAPEPQVTTSRSAAHGRAAVRAATVQTTGGRLSGSETAYFRIDARLERSWTTDLFGMDATLTPYAALLNVLDGNDAVFYQRASSGLELQPVSGVPLLPLVGMRWQTDVP